MLKYTTTIIGFREIPDEISLCINISGCPLQCYNCHSPELRNNIGNTLNAISISNLIEQNKGITCICFMGGLNDVEALNELASFVKVYTNFQYKTACYLGCDVIPDNLDLKKFNFVKIGPYIESLGPLDDKNTNQRLYKVDNDLSLSDITYKFWK